MKRREWSSDQPISNPKLDTFNRYPFAKSIAKSIVTRSDPSSIVVGIYGAWGTGKSSVLKFIESELSSEHKDEVVIVYFNPWEFSSDHYPLLLSFFGNLSKALDKNLEGKGEKFGKLLRGSSSLATPVPGGEQIMDGIGRWLSDIDLAEYKSRLQEFLLESGKK